VDSEGWAPKGGARRVDLREWTMEDRTPGRWAQEHGPQRQDRVENHLREAEGEGIEEVA